MLECFRFVGPLQTALTVPVLISVPGKRFQRFRQFSELGRIHAVSETTLSNTKFIEFLCRQQIPGSKFREELSEFFQPLICAPKRTQRGFHRTH